MAAPKPGSLRDRQRQAEQGTLFPSAAPKPSQRSTARPSGPPAGYGNEMLWAMAEEFEKQAWANRVALRGSTPYIYKAMSQAFDRLGMQTLTCTDGKGREVRGVELGLRLVRFFWNRWPWDRDGDVISQFSDSMSMRAVLRELRGRWESRRLHALAQEKMRTYEPEEFQRVPKHPVGYKHLGG